MPAGNLNSPKPLSASLPDDILARWQNVVDVMAEVVQVPAGLIMRIDGAHIEVFKSSRTEGNPYAPGDKEVWRDSGLYCETVVKTNDRLLVPDAMVDPDWDRNPDLEVGLVSYLGFPIFRPSGEVFGTLCVLDNKANSYTPTVEGLMLELKDVIESHLALLDAKQRLETSLAEIRTLRGILPMCSYCKNVRDDQGYWRKVEEYLLAHTEAEMSHGICPDCLEQHHPTVAAELRPSD